MRISSRALPALSLLLLAGCGMTDGVFSRRGVTPPNDSLTTQRVMGTDPAFETLKPEPGNVWPAEQDEAPRATLGTANPDAMPYPATTPVR